MWCSMQFYRLIKLKPVSLTGLFLSGYGVPWHPHFPVSRWGQSGGSHSLLMGINKLQQHHIAIQLPPTDCLCENILCFSHKCSFSSWPSELFISNYHLYWAVETISVSLYCLSLWLFSLFVSVCFGRLKSFYDVNKKWLVLSFYELDFNGPYIQLRESAR